MSNGNTYIKNFEKFITEKSIATAVGYKESDIKYHVIKGMLALQENDKEQFQLSLKNIKARNVDEHTPWIYDDILLLILSIGVTKFELNKEWINNLCLIRSRVQEGSNKFFAESIHYLINGSKSKVDYLGILFFSLTNVNVVINQEELNEVFTNAKNFLEISDNQIDRAIASASIHHIIKLKGLDDLSLRRKQEYFMSQFQKKANIIAKTLFWILFPLSIFDFYYLIYLSIEYISALPDSSLAIFLANLVTSVISFVPIFFIYKKREQIINWFLAQIYSFWGKVLPTELTKDK